MKIFKYAMMSLYPSEVWREMPAGAQILDVQLQHGHLQLWALVDPAQPPEMRKFILAFTGDSVPDDARHLTTFQVNGGEYVFHVFELESRR